MDKNKEKLMNACCFVADFFAGEAYDIALTTLINFAEDLGIIKKSTFCTICGWGDEYPKEAVIADVLLGTRFNQDGQYYARKHVCGSRDLFNREDGETILPPIEDAHNILIKNIALLYLQPDMLLVRQILKVLIDFAVALGILSQESGDHTISECAEDMFYSSRRPVYGYNEHISRLQRHWDYITTPLKGSENV